MPSQLTTSLPNRSVDEDESEVEPELGEVDEPEADDEGEGGDDDRNGAHHLALEVLVVQHDERPVLRLHDVDIGVVRAVFDGQTDRLAAAIEAILAENGEPVEFGQVLFVVDQRQGD